MVLLPGADGTPPAVGHSLLIAPRFFTLRLDGPGRTAPLSEDQPERLADLSVEPVSAPELGQRGARNVLEAEAGLLSACQRLAALGLDPRQPRPNLREPVLQIPDLPGQPLAPYTVHGRLWRLGQLPQIDRYLAR